MAVPLTVAPGITVCAAVGGFTIRPTSVNVTCVGVVNAAGCLAPAVCSPAWPGSAVIVEAERACGVAGHAGRIRLLPCEETTIETGTFAAGPPPASNVA